MVRVQDPFDELEGRAFADDAGAFDEAYYRRRGVPAIRVEGGVEGGNLGFDSDFAAHGAT
jgi:hypothetical protein